MNANAIQIINNKNIWLRIKDLQKEFGISRPTAMKLVEGVRQQMIKGRYSRYSISGKFVNYFAFIDYMTYETELNDSSLCKSVPQFDPREIADISGFYNLRQVVR